MKKMYLNHTWQFKEKNDAKWYEASLPASVMNTLLQAGEIEDPFYRDNERLALDVASNDYIFKKDFKLDSTLMDYDQLSLKFHGIDTIANVFLNGQLILESNNMHRIYEIPVKSLLKAGINTIEVLLFSPLHYIEEKQASDRLIGVDHAVDGYQHLRKAHSMFGWDWGPKIPDLGIWRDVELLAWNENRIEDVHIIQHHSQDEVQLELNVETEKELSENEKLVLKVTSPEGNLQMYHMDTLSFTVPIENPKLWWPSGYGEQSLYQVEVEIISNEKKLDSKLYPIGLRTINVKHEEDQWGKSFAFVINGHPIFMKGANYIPEDNLLPRTSREKTEQLIKDCVEANFNMIRVWGGGHYPEDYFFELCDQYGIIVWQDFMYACSVYRLTDEFKENAVLEAIDQIKRIRHHACLGIWCGNNEVEEAMEYWGWPKKADWRRDYIKLFEIILPEIVEKYDPNTFYWSSSPSSGGGFDEPRNPDIGDVHYWQVWHGQKPFTDYRNYYFRFCSEFGFQSFPSLKTVESFTIPEDRNIFSKVMENHQKNDDANGKILYYLSENFLYPKDFDALLYTSQLLQAEAIKYGVEHWRRNLGRCMGSLYWQLNDCWPVASWSSVDYFGRWKALHYYAKKFYDPILLSLEEGEKDVSIYLTNDKLEAVNGKIEWKLRHHDSTVIEQGLLDVVVEGSTAKVCDRLDFSSMIDDNTKENLYFEATFYKGNSFYSHATVIFTKPKHFHFLDPQLAFSVQEDPENYLIEVSSKAYTKYVELLVDADVVLSDNYFDLSKDEPRVITLSKHQLKSGLSIEELEKKIQVRSVYHITHE